MCRKRSAETIFCREEVKIWKNGNKWAVTIKEKYVGKQNAMRAQIEETHGRQEGILTRWLHETDRN
jgi:hypothetical protein